MDKLKLSFVSCFYINVLITFVIRETDGEILNGFLTKCWCLQLVTQCVLDIILHPLISQLALRGQARISCTNNPHRRG